ncbi:UNVERIFIED_CONTAM: hypothetical protein FKN15_033553 [Acipenser sinensis]
MLSIWRRSVSEVQALQAAVSVCKKAQASLVRVTACFQQLVLSVGGSSDCSRLREELEETRLRAHQISTGLCSRLTALLTGGRLFGEEQQEVERLWVLFLSGLELLQLELRKAFHLQAVFPLASPRDSRALVNTGASGRSAEVAAQAASVQTPWGEAEEKGEGAPPNLLGHIALLDSMVQEMVQKVNVPIWTVAASEEGDGEMELELEGATSEEMLTTDEEQKRGCFRGWLLCLMP